MLLPIKKGDIRITSPYGNRVLNGVSGFHAGLDIIGQDSDEIVSVTDGRVLWSQIITDRSNPTWEWGNYVAVTGEDGVTIYYCHMAERKVKAGDRVKAGDVIGIMGNTGYSFGKHLHFEVRPNNYKAANAADYLGVANLAQSVLEAAYYEREVVKKCGFTRGTVGYMNAYTWAGDLWRKLAVYIAAKNRGGKRDIIDKCGFLPHTVKYIDAYRFAPDFWRKIGNVN